MKPFDTKGEYTPEEVKAALAGADGTRQLSYRYERLDKNNSFIEDIDYVQSCTIENNALADIKRTAKLDILDTGTINYLQDRIKPYVRLTMPDDETYSDAVKSLGPIMWWRMDDAGKTIPAMTYNEPADTLAYQTAATAFPVDASANTYTELPIQAGSATVRQEAWVFLTITNSDALDIWPDISKVNPPNIGVAVVGTIDIYYRSSAESALELIDHMDIAEFFGARTLTIPFPQLGTYYVRFRTTETVSGVIGSVSIHRPARLEDSSGNNVYGTVDKRSIMRSSPLVSDSGYAAKYPSNELAGGVSVDTEEDISGLNLALDGGFTINFWEDASLDSGGQRVLQDWSTTNGRLYFTRSSANSETGLMQYHLSASYNDGTVEGGCTRQLYVPKSALTVGTRMTTVTFSSKGIKAYSNGSLVVEIDDEAATSFAGSANLYTEKIAHGVMTIFGAGVSLDDVSAYSTALSAGEISNLYAKGTSGVSGRSGFVEWPQGVFVLSSPTRKMIEGNTVIRSVEGYDQLVVLKEDSFDYRYAVKAGVSYTDAVKSVLQTTVAPSKVSLREPMWTDYNGAEIISDSSATFFGPGAYLGIQTEDNSVAFGGISITAKITGTIDGYFLMYARIGGEDFGFHKSSSGNLLLVNKGSSTALVTYNATTHKYWRFRESNGLLHWDTSADGATWTNLLTATNPMKAEDAGRIIVEGNRISSSTLRVDEFSLIASRNTAVNVVHSTKTLPTAMEWEPGTSKLQVVNDLLSAINYESASYDEDGFFIGRPYIRPQDRSSGFRYATDSESVLTGDVNQTVDLFGVPNKWVVVVSEPDRPPLTGTYVNDNPLSPTSTVSRGRTVVDFRTEQNAPDQVTLDAQAERLAFEASQVYEVIEFNTAVMPIHQNADVYDLIIDGLVVDSKYSEHTWSMELRNGGTMSHKVRKVVSV